MSLIKKKPAARQAKKESLIFGCLLTRSADLAFNGLHQANNDFLRAIIRYSQFHELHIFTEPTVLAALQAEWSEYIEHFGSNKVIHFLPAHALPEYFSKTRYQVFHQGDPYIGHLTALRDSCAVLPFPVTGRAHTLSTDSYLSRSRDLLLSPLKGCDSILCSSQAQQQVMKRLLSAASASIADQIGAAIPYKGTLGLLPLGIEPDNAFSGSQAEARELLGYDADQFVILALGRITATDKMDLHPLLLALNDLVEVKAVRKVTLVIAGAADASGEAVQSLLKRAYDLNLESSVRFELTVDDERKQWLMAASDVFVSVSDNIQESFGLTPLEAMIHKRPVILSNWNGYRELVVDGNSGFLINSLSGDLDNLSRTVGVLLTGHAHLIQAQATAIDIDQLASVFEQLWQDSEKRLQAGRAGYERVLQLYQWKQVIADYHIHVEQLNHEAEKLAHSLSRPVGIPYYEVFKHYPSEQLSNKTCFMTTDRGVRVLNQSEAGFSYSDIGHLLDTDNVQTLVRECLKGQRLSELQTTYPDSQELKFTLLWMCKYQLLKVVDQPVPDNKKQSTYWLPEEKELPKEVSTLLRATESYRYKLIEPVLSWFAEQSVNDNHTSQLQADILNHVLQQLDTHLLQAIGWFADELGEDNYSEVLSQLEERGGLRFLVDRYPHWYRLNRRRTIWMLKSCRLFFQRLQVDLALINTTFNEQWGGDAGSVQSISFPLGKSFASVVQVTFDNQASLIYKNRDIRFDHQLVGKTKDQGNIAAHLNQWLGNAPGLATLQMLPRWDNAQYGYCEVIEHDVDEVLDNEQAENYYQRLGVLTAVAVFTGIGDLHHCNVISKGAEPYVVDAKTAFRSKTLRFVEAELTNPVVSFSRGFEESSFERTGLWHLWRSFHTGVIHPSKVKLMNGQLISGNPQQWYPAEDNLIRVEGRSSFDGVQPSLAANYAISVIGGFRAAVVAISEHHEEWKGLLQACAGFGIRHSPLLNTGDVEKQLWDFQTFEGFQDFSLSRLHQYFQQMSMRVVLGGEEIQRWLEPQWKEDVAALAEPVKKSWMTGEQPDFVACIGEKGIAYRLAGQVSPVIMEADFFQQDGLGKAVQLAELIGSDHQCRDQFVAGMSGMLLQWLEEQLAPGDRQPEALKKNKKGS